MKKIILFSIVLLSIVINAQNKVINVEYEVFYNTERPNVQIANLFISDTNDEAIYKKGGIKQNSDVEKDEFNNLSIKFNSKKMNCNYFNQKKDSLFSIESIAGDEYLIKEKKPIINWELIDEEKLIDNIKVSKAICSFRGRKYTAWYSLDYPIKYGPWKLHGLPGLIFEVHDDSKRFNWNLKKITYLDYSESIFVIDSNDVKQISIQEYPKIKYNSNIINQKLIANFPRETIVTDGVTNRNGLEIKFEWE